MPEKMRSIRRQSVRILKRLLITAVVFFSAIVFIQQTIIMPNYNAKRCSRPCVGVDWPLICRFSLVIDATNVRSGENDSDRLLQIFTVNGQTPGPAIRVCQNDIVVVNVENRLPGRSVTIHWHGQHQRETPFMDGVPLVTQCPIGSFTTFQYKFRATQSGTHLYRAFAGTEAALGIAGSLIVSPKVHRKTTTLHTSVFAAEFTILLNENGREVRVSIEPPLKRIVMRPGELYRFRVAYLTSLNGCLLNVSIFGHVMTIFELDSNAIEPILVESFDIATGERIDFILRSDQETHLDYPLRVNSFDKCSINAGTGIVLSYLQTERSKENCPITVQLFVNRFNFATHYTVAKSTKAFPANLLQVTETFLISLNRKSSHKIFNNELYERNKYSVATLVGNWQNKKDADVIAVANRGTKMFTIGTGACHNSYLPPNNLHIPLDTSVEIVLADSEFLGPFTYHLHGHGFYVTLYHHLNEQSFNSENTNITHLLEKHRQFNDPPQKDVIHIPKGYLVAIRFMADNPGQWMLREMGAADWTRGLDIVLHVGEKRDAVPAPADFPTCRNWLGPDFFLI